MARSPKKKNLTVEDLEAREVPATAYALTDFNIVASANQLISFDTATPQTVIATKGITGLVAGDTVVGIDFRPANGQLYGLGANLAANTVQVYTINPATGAAAAVGTPQNVAAIIGAQAFGVDFNPLADRIRVVTSLPSDGNAAGSNTNNFRLNPTTGALVAIDPDLVFPGGVGSPEVAVSYTNSKPGPAPAATQLFGILSGADSLVSHATAPGFQDLSTVGTLGIDTGTAAGLDIYGADNKAVAILTTVGVANLYTVNLTTGAATLVNTVGNGLTPVSDVTVAPNLGAGTAGGSADGKVQLFASTAGTGQAALGASVPAFTGSTTVVRSTTGDVNGDGVPDLIAVTGPGTPVRVTVLSGLDNTTVLVAAFDPFGDPNFKGGAFVSAGDLDGDNKAEFIVSPDQGGGPRVTIFSRNADGTVATKANFFGIDDPNFRGGARTALGDVNGDTKLDLAVAAGFLGGPRTALFNGTTILGTPTRLIGDFFAFPGTDATTLRNGVFVAMSDIDGDGKDDMVFGGGPGGAPRVFILSGAKIAANDVAGAQAAPIANFFVANNSSDRGGVRVAYEDLDGDTKGDLAVGSGEGSAANVRLYRGVNFTTTAEPAVFQDIAVFGGAVLAGGVFVG